MGSHFTCFNTLFNTPAAIGFLGCQFYLNPFYINFPIVAQSFIPILRYITILKDT